MSDIKLISPMLDGFCIGEPISDQNGVRCCPAMKENEDDRYIVKVVSIPASQTKLDALLLAGAYSDAEAAKGYFQELANGLVDELNVLKELSSQEGFLPIRQWQIVPMEGDATGFDVYMLTDYKRTLKRQFYKEPLTHLNAVNLGLDICEALAVCRQAGYLFVDLKPSNIFVTAEKKYKISDLGFVKQDSLMYASLPAQYRSAYTAPEVADAFSALSPNMDIYALGLVLYQAYNNGALPFSGDTAPAERFPAPDYADYEMAEIILKACDPDPQNRWQDPLEMGQALINYMQRNGVNDTPIVPPLTILESVKFTEPLVPELYEEISEAVDQELTAESASEEPGESEVAEEHEAETTETAEDESFEEPVVEQTPAFEEDDLGNLSFLTSMEEIPEDVNTEQIEYTELSEDVNEMLEQVDDLAAHDVPDMEEAVEEAQEAELVQDAPSEEDQPGEDLLDSASEDNQEINTEAAPTDEQAEEETQELNEETENNAQKTVIFSTTEGQPQVSDEATVPDTAEPIINPDPEAKPKHRWVTVLVVLLILLALAVGAYCGYRYYYIKTIDALTLDGDLDTLTVSVSSNADPKLLTVYCVGNGNRTPAVLVDGKAHFTNLVPDQRYNVVVEISGFHGLNGKTSSTYYTPSQIALDGLQVKVGEADGSAVITFTTKKPYDGEWNVEYVADGEDKQTATASTGNITLNNLTVGKTYEITITPTDDHSWVTNNSCTFTALPLIIAQNVTVADYNNGNLNLTWEAPDNTTVGSWTVHCYNDTDYNKTITVSDCNAAFDSLDPMKSYTVEIYAEQQSKGQMIHIDDATLPIDSFIAELDEFNFINLTWTCSKPTPEEGWIVKYTINGQASDKTLTTAENTLVFKEVIPGATYSFTIEAGNGAPVITTNVEITAGEAEGYKSNYGNQAITKDNITLKMCNPPASDNWNYKDLYANDYTTSFKVGEKAGFVTRILKYYDTKEEADVFVLYIIRDQEGNVVLTCSEERTWINLWDYYFGVLTVPEMPSEAGSYTIEVYFNGGLLGEKEFEITE